MSALSLALEVEDTTATAVFLEALGAGALVSVRPVAGESEGFRGFSISLICAQPADVDALLATAVEHGASVLKPATRSFWGYGGVVRGPDGNVWKVAASSKKNAGDPVARFDHLVLLLGVTDVKASKQFYVDQGLTAGKSFGGKYAEITTSGVNLSLYPRKAAAKDAGVDPAGSGSHRVTLVGDLALTDPDGFTWERA